MINVFLKSTVLPLLSVNLPSSKIWSIILNTSGWAFSISSKSTTEYGFLRTASVNWPPSSYPTYPGGAPTSLETLCFSIYSDISILISASSSLNINSASDFASSVLPTPVGPKNKKVPIGRFGSFKPERARRIASETVSTASSWPIRRLCKISSILISFCFSLSTSLLTGIPVHLLTTFAISSSFISSLSNLFSECSLFWTAFNCFLSSRSLPYLSSAAVCKSVLRSASSIFAFTFSISSFIPASPVIEAFSCSHWAFNFEILPSNSLICLVKSSTFARASSSDSFLRASLSISSWIFWRIILSISSGMLSISIRKDEAASSIKSIALSGKNLSVMYLSESFAAWIKALSKILMPWWTSYFSLSPLKIEIVSSTDGSPTKTGWKRLSNAGSFSIYLRYSLIVVAPIVLKTPRASMGFKRFPASIEPSVAPAPTTVWSSSINITISPFEVSTSFNTAFKRSSNSPLNFAPATRAPISSETSLTFLRLSGTSPRTILCAKPSTIAVLPTPGSPISTGLFFVRRFKTWIIRLTSSSRPITGSNFPFLASAVKSVEYFSSAFIFSSAFLLSTFLLPLIFFIAFKTLFVSTPAVCKRFWILLLSNFVMARRIASIPINSSFNSSACACAKSSSL